MLMYTWMVWVEKAPERYDQAVKIMTGGKIDTIKKIISLKIKPGEKVLDIGCGTGSLALQCVERGATVTGVDSSMFMLNECNKKIKELNLEGQFNVVLDSVTQLEKNFKKESFDFIVSTMVVGEFPKDYMDYIFNSCKELLKPGGKIMIADEVWPKSFIYRQLFKIIMGILWIPQFLILRRAFYPIKDLEEIIIRAGFKIISVKNWPGSTFQLVEAEKVIESVII